MNFTRALHLRRWCEDGGSRAQFPQMVRKLILASLRANRIEFPAFEEVQQGGWDGVVEVSEGNNFVPAGLSVWELSTEARILQKAEADLTKRSAEPLGFNKAEATAVFATLRRWPNRRSRKTWENEQRSRGGWRDVRVLDASDFEAWLENAPAIDWWLAYILGLRPAGASDFARHWAALSTLSEPKLKPCVFLASRTSAVEQLDHWIAENASVLSVEATTPGESIDFIATWLVDRPSVEARALLVESRDAWRALAGPGSPLLLVAHPTLKLEAELASEAILHGHHVAFPTNAGAGGVLSVPRVRHHHLHEALIDCGFGFEQAARHARETGGHLGVLKRRLAAATGIVPAWAIPPAAIEIAPLVLAGAWIDSMDGDIQVVTDLASIDSTQVASLARRWSQVEDAPLIQNGHAWRFTSREESWWLLARNLTREQLQHFEQIAVSVLSDTDPRYALPMADRAYASLRHQVPKQSWKLRKGIAETVALLGRSGDDVPGRPIAERIVRSLLHDADWQQWASLSGVLPLLAEAAPDAFLTAAENDLGRPEPSLLRLFLEEDKGPWGASHPHTGMLWAFEVLSWSPDYLSRASLCLAQLSRLDPGGKLCNRPIRSLHDTFLPWAPHTAADAQQRFQVLNYLIEKEPETTWKLLLAFLPRQSGCTNPRAYPQWADWANCDLKRVSGEEYVQQIDAIAERIVDYAAGKNECWPLLIEKLERFPHGPAEQILDRLRKLTPAELGEAKSCIFWNQLRAKVAWHRRCGNEVWALRREVTEALSETARRFEPEDPLELYAWLFLPGSLMEFYEERNNYESSRLTLEAAQITAMKAIFARHGLDGLRSLVTRVGHSSAMGFHLADQGIFCDDQKLLPEGFDPVDENWRSFALGYAAGRFKSGGWAWLAAIEVGSWIPEQAGWLSHVLTFEPATWRWFERLGPDFQRAYWKRVNPWPGDLVEVELEEGMSCLIAEDRARSALNLLHNAHFQKKPLAHSLIARGLEAFLLTKEVPPNAERARETAWEVCELMKHLTKSPELPADQLAQLEWGLLGILRAREHYPKALLDWMVRSPSLFAEVVATAYLKSPPDQVGTGSRREHAQELLRSWRTLPGLRDDGTVDAGSLNGWCDQARTECCARECSDVGDFIIGKILSTSPLEKDGSWPQVAVRDCIERVASDSIERGFYTGTFNKRGITTHALAEGGDQERALAAKYQGYADACKFRWPRFARQLSALATFYEEDGRRQDRRALDE